MVDGDVVLSRASSSFFGDLRKVLDADLFVPDGILRIGCFSGGA
jgi:hypothetical protein